MKIKVAKKYRETEQLVYQINLLAWKNYVSYLPDFTGFNAKYTQAYADSALATAEAAAALPGASARKAASKIARDKLFTCAKKCTGLFSLLLRYIHNCFDATEAENMKQAAGAGYYADALRQSWKQLSELNAAAIAFLDKYSTELKKEGNGMPVDFVASFTKAKTNFDNRLQEYNNSKLEVMQQTAVKTGAFNGVYQTLSSMLKDGRSIFSGNKEVQDLFNFNSLAKMAGKTTRTGVHITVLESETKLPVTTTRFVLEPGNIIGTVDSNGIADVSLTSGKYSFVATTPGYNTVTITKLVMRKDTMRRLNILLQKAVAVA